MIGSDCLLPDNEHGEVSLMHSGTTMLHDTVGGTHFNTTGEKQLDLLAIWEKCTFHFKTANHLDTLIQRSNNQRHVCVPSVLIVPQRPLWFSVASGGIVVDPEEDTDGNEILLVQLLVSIFLLALILLVTSTDVNAIPLPVQPQRINDYL